METLLKSLEELYSNENDIFIEEDFIGFQDSELHSRILSLCNELLIVNNGGCNWENIEIVRDNGYRVFGGEKDGFGWLTGCIRKVNDKRVIVFG